MSDSDELNKNDEITLGVSFSNDIFLSESFLKQNKIEYTLEDLEQGPFGSFYRIRLNKELEEVDE